MVRFCRGLWIFRRSRTGGDVWWAVSRATPVAVTPGKGGWSIRLVQKIGSGVVEAEPLEEPFVLAVTQDGVTEVYSGCYWNHIQRSHGNDGLKVVRKGFALAQEVTQDG